MTLGTGEVVAITGLVGVGKTALAETLFGVRKPLAGTMHMDGKPYTPGSAREAIAAGVFLVAKDRAASGIVGGFNIERNISLPFLKRMSGLGVMKKRAERAVARRQIDELGIVCRSEKDELSALSGGNQQKVMVARWMSQASRLFILDERRRPRDAHFRHRDRRGAGDRRPYPGDVGTHDRRRAPQRRHRPRPAAGGSGRRTASQRGVRSCNLHGVDLECV
jgi:ABC-type sugar transport system ATPase subunit